MLENNPGRAVFGHDYMITRQISVEDAFALLDFYARNKEYLAPWEPARPKEFYTLEFWQDRVSTWDAEAKSGVAAHFSTVDDSGSLVAAICSLTNIVRGPFQACHIGFAVSEDMQGKGIGSGLVSYATERAFAELRLNRVMANYMPRNERSDRLLRRLGFTEQGFASRYLLINGVGEDHILTSLVNPSNKQV